METKRLFSKRSVSETHVNAYNPTLLKMWRANIDLQYVLNTYASASYCASYITKVEHGMSKLLCKAAKEVQSTNSNVKEQLRVVASKFLNAIETGALKAVYVCLYH